MKQARGLTLIQAMVAVAVIGMVMSLLFAEAGKERLRKMQLRNTTQLRGIMQSLIVYANGNREWYPGLDAKGELVDVSTAGVFQVLLEENYFTGEYTISPVEDLEPWQPGQDQKVTTDQLSYAILDLQGLDKEDGRRREWRTTINTQAAVLSDRNTKAEDGYASIWTPFSDKEGWQGGIAWNDGRASFQTTPLLDDTKYGRGEPNESDHLFEADDADDALMTFLKDEEGKEKIIPARPVPDDVDPKDE